MQNKQKIIDVGFKTLLFAFIVGGIWFLLQDKGESLQDVFAQIKSSFRTETAIIWVLLFALTFLNWGLEAKKWQLLVQNIEKINFVSAYKTVLSAMSLGYLTPLGLGDWGVKMATFQEKNRANSFGVIILGGGIQVFVSWFFGTLALTYFVISYRLNWFSLALLGILYIGLAFGFWALWKRNQLDVFMEKYKTLAKLKKYFAAIENYQTEHLTHIFLLTTARYFIFVAQLVILFYLFGIRLSFLEMAIGAVFVFFIKAIVPLLNFASDLGVRELSALYYFNYFGVLPSMVVGASLSLWFINILLPMCVGAIFVFKIKNKDAQT